MGKICCLIIMSCVFSLFLSACTIKQSTPMIKSERRLGKYIQPQKEQKGGVVDLSEGPRLKYDAVFGPKTPSFDFKIVNPY